MSEVVLNIEGIEPLDLYGENNIKINVLKKAYPDVQITSRGNIIKLKGDKKNIETVKSKLEVMVRMVKEKPGFTVHDVEELLMDVDNLEEKILPHLKGFRDSPPVRIGNGAYSQKQNDIYGVLIDAIYLSFQKFPSSCPC